MGWGEDYYMLKREAGGRDGERMLGGSELQQWELEVLLCNCLRLPVLINAGGGALDSVLP